MNIDLSLLPKQLEAFNLLNDKKHNYILFGGSKSCGKTRLLVYWSIINCLKYPGIKGVWARAHLSVLKQTTLATFYDVCREWGLDKDVYWSFNSQLNVISFYNGSSIVLKDLFMKPSDKEFISLGSLEASFGCIDEAGEIKVEAFINLRNTLRYRLGDFDIIPKMLIVSNPTRNWLYDEFYKPYKDKDEPDNQKYIHTIPEDNSYNSEDYLNVLRQMKGSDRERLYLGNWDYGEDLNNLFDYDSLSNSFYNKIDNTNNNNYLSIDIALEGNDSSVICYWKGLILKKIYVYNKMKAPDLIEKIKEIELRHKVKRSNIVVDSIGVGAISAFLKGCRQFISNEKPLKYKQFNNLKAECFYTIANYFDEGMIQIEDDKYKDTIIQEFQSFKRHKVDEDGKSRITPKKEVKGYLGRSPDYCEAIAMRMIYELKKNNKIIMDVV